MCSFEHIANSIRLWRVIGTSCVILPSAVICASRVNGCGRIEYHCEDTSNITFARQKHHAAKGGISLAVKKEHT